MFAGRSGTIPTISYQGPASDSRGRNRPDPAADGIAVADHLSYERLVHDRRCRRAEIPAVERAARQGRDVEYREEGSVDLIRSDVTSDAWAAGGPFLHLNERQRLRAGQCRGERHCRYAELRFDLANDLGLEASDARGERRQVRLRGRHALGID